MNRCHSVFVLSGSLISLLLAAQGAMAAATENPAAFRALVQADWTLQEKRLDRTTDAPAAIHDAAESQSPVLALVQYDGDVVLH